MRITIDIEGKERRVMNAQSVLISQYVMSLWYWDDGKYMDIHLPIDKTTRIEIDNSM